MGGFNELIRNFDKIRDYMRDFYVYGFKSRSDFKLKSPRTYDNEKRRIESYLGQYMKWDYSKSGKTAFISMDCSKIPVNPLYAAWKSKTFTSNDIMLHFYILDVLKRYKNLTIDEITDKICQISGNTFDVQTVRNKCNEYTKIGIIYSEKQGKSLCYSLSEGYFKKLSEVAPGIMDAIKFYQGCAPLGVIGSFILDLQNTTNDRFTFKHNYVAHTLEDEILIELLKAIRKNHTIEMVNYSKKTGWVSYIECIPLKIFVSSVTGRRYICVYKPKTKRFFSYRLDHIQSVKITGTSHEAPNIREDLEKNIDRVWSVNFGGYRRIEMICMKLYIDEEKEKYVLERIAREGQGGELVKLEENTFLYTKEIFELDEISPWVKTFIGRIIQLEGTNQQMINRFYNDIKRMKEMYYA